jgi:hypothetical protein
MKPILLSLVIFLCVPQLMLCMSEEPHKEAPEDRTEKIAQEGYKLIDILFDKAQASVVAREEIMTSEWISKQEEIRQLQNLHSDAYIEITCDHGEQNTVPKKLATYVEHKIKEEIPLIFAIDGITINRVKDFYQFAHTMCALSGGSRCGRMVRSIESDNFDKLLKLKLEKIARKQLKKEESEYLRQALLIGAHRQGG